MPSAPPAQPSLDSMILSSGALNIEALKRADGLREVITQVRTGVVANMRDLYGPKQGRATNPMWANIKGTITRRERLASELNTEFNGNTEKFFAFFTFVPEVGGKKRKATTASVEKLRPLRLVVQAIPHRNKDLQHEKESNNYQQDGVFSDQLWLSAWAGKNQWEIWRAIGKEKY